MPDTLPCEVRKLLTSDPLLAEYFRGAGAWRGDLSGSGYDWRVVSILIRRGVTDPRALEKVLAARPGRQDKGARYFARTVERALLAFDRGRRAGGPEARPKAGGSPPEGGLPPVVPPRHSLGGRDER